MITLTSKVPRSCGIFSTPVGIIDKVCVDSLGILSSGRLDPPGPGDNALTDAGCVAVAERLPEALLSTAGTAADEMGHKFEIMACPPSSMSHV